MKTLVVGNAGDADPGFVGDRLESVGFALSAIDREEPGSWPSLAGFDLVVLLGSEWSVYWDRVAREVEAESALALEAHRRGVPVLGICFGAQLLAHAHGGTVQRARRPEIGWHEVLAPTSHAVLAGTWLQWHSDSFIAPAHAETPALSDVGSQALRIGRTFGCQFHPEANEAIVTRWVSGDGVLELASTGATPHELLDRTRTEVVGSEARAHALVDWFLDEVATTTVNVGARN